MEEGKRYFRLGLFVFLTVTILAAILFILGGRSLFQPTFTFETYFSESVAGLEVGSPVQFRGVPLGQVAEILTSASAYEREVPIEKRRNYIVVRAKVTSSRAEVEQVAADVAQMVSLGLRAQTQLAGITGQQYLALDFLDPKTHPSLAFDWQPKHRYVPSAPSSTAEIVGSAQRFLASLDKADVKVLGQNLNKLIVTANDKLGELPMRELSADARALLKSARATVTDVDRVFAAGAPLDGALRSLDSASARLDGLLADPALKQTADNLAAATGRLRKLAESGELDRMVKNIDSLAERLDGMVADNQYDVQLIVRDLQSTAANLRALSEAIKRYPAGALVGGPPEKVQLPGKEK